MVWIPCYGMLSVASRIDRRFVSQINKDNLLKSVIWLEFQFHPKSTLDARMKCLRWLVSLASIHHRIRLCSIFETSAQCYYLLIGNRFGNQLEITELPIWFVVNVKRKNQLPTIYICVLVCFFLVLPSSSSPSSRISSSNRTTAASSTSSATSGRLCGVLIFRVIKDLLIFLTLILISLLIGTAKTERLHHYDRWADEWMNVKDSNSEQFLLICGKRGDGESGILNGSYFEMSARFVDHSPKLDSIQFPQTVLIEHYKLSPVHMQYRNDLECSCCAFVYVSVIP